MAYATTAALNTETAARKAADTTEVNARIAAGTKEVNARTIAVNSLDARLKVIEPQVADLLARVAALEAPSPPPSAPTNLTAVRGDRLITLSWS